MPTTVAEALSAAGLRVAGTTPWGTPIDESGPGVYVVSLTADPDSTAGALPEAPIDLGRVDALLAARPELRLDGMRPDTTLLARRLASFWLADETILYLGLAGTSVRNRVGAYYRSPLGARRPHSGGWFLKTLTALDGLWVHHAPCADPIAAEDRMLAAFTAGVTPAVAAGLHDPTLPLPFANLEWPKGVRKAHGIEGARGPLPAGSDPVGGAGLRHTQGVTAADLREGRLRVPRATKALFPAEPGTVAVRLRGHAMQGEWDPGTGARRERSGVLRVAPDVLDGLVTTGEVLLVRAAEADGTDGGAGGVVLD